MSGRTLHAQLCLAWLGALAALSGCEGPPGPRTDSRVYLLEGTPGVDFQVEPDRLLFPVAGYEQLLARQPDDILVSSVGTGLFRAVVSVASADGTIVIATRPAVLGEAIIDGNVSGQAGMPDEGRWTVDGKWDGILPFDGLLEIGRTAILGNGEITAEVIDSRIRYKPDFQLDLDLNDRRVTYFEAIAEGSLEATLVVQVQTTGSVTVRQNQILWRSAPQTLVQWVGTVPVVEVVTLTFGVGVEVAADGAATFEGGGSLTTTLRAGAVYDYWTGGWGGVGERSVAVVPLGQVTDGTASIDVSVYLFAQLDIMFYDVAGPFLYVAPYVGVRHETGAPGWEPLIGIRGAWGGHVSIFGETLAGFEAELFDITRPL